MATAIGERVEVIAVFDRGLRPVRFRWNGRVYPVREVTYQWRSREGSAVVIHFSVSDGANLFELVYNQNTMQWSLEGVEA